MRRIILVLSLLPLLFSQCKKAENKTSLINTDHLNYLFTHLQVEGQPLAGVVIYAEYPDYRFVEAPGEGLICVDDIARAAIVYLRYAHYYNDPLALNRARQLLHTVLKLQAPNGLFYNFVDGQGNIQKELHNSRPLPNWWAWRAFWSLAEYLNYIGPNKTGLRDSVHQAIQKILPHVRQLFDFWKQTQIMAGFEAPLWLPLHFAADQAGLLLKALCTYYRAAPDQEVVPMIRKLASGIMAMQINDARSEFYGAFLSWQNIWHAYGNIQADALFDAFEVTGDSTYFKAAIKEVDNFYPQLLKKGLLHEARLLNEQGRVKIIRQRRFEQIAYDLRPMIWATLHAWRLTKSEKFKQQTITLTSWFAGQNVARKMMYNPENGRCFDGIISEQKINLNSGAESTIEALLALMEVEREKEMKTALKNLWK